MVYANGIFVNKNLGDNKGPKGYVTVAQQQELNLRVGSDRSVLTGTFVRTIGYHSSWGKYLGTLAIMIDYLKALDLTKYNHYRDLVKSRKYKRLTDEEILALKKEILADMPIDIQRKFTFGNGDITC